MACWVEVVLRGRGSGGWVVEEGGRPGVVWKSLCVRNVRLIDTRSRDAGLFARVVFAWGVTCVTGGWYDDDARDSMEPRRRCEDGMFSMLRQFGSSLCKMLNGPVV